MLIAMSCIPAGDAMAKLLVQHYAVPTTFIAWARFGVGFLLILPFVNRRNFRLAGLMDWRVLLRGVLIGAAVSAILRGVAAEDLATVFGAFFIGPILSYFLSALVLGERIGAAQTALLFIGFCGVLLVVKPGFGMTPGVTFAALAGVLYGIYLTTGRWLSSATPPMPLLFAQHLVVRGVLTPTGLPDTPEIGGAMGPLLLLSGLFSMLGNFLLLFAYRAGEATRLAPFVYFQLVAATVLGLVIFGDLPDALALLGVLLLLASGFASLALRRPA